MMLKKVIRNRPIIMDGRLPTRIKKEFNTQPYAFKINLNEVPHIKDNLKTGEICTFRSTKRGYDPHYVLATFFGNSRIDGYAMFTKLIFQENLTLGDVFSTDETIIFNEEGRNGIITTFPYLISTIEDSAFDHFELPQLDYDHFCTTTQDLLRVKNWNPETDTLWIGMRVFVTESEKLYELNQENFYQATSWTEIEYDREEYENHKRDIEEFDRLDKLDKLIHGKDI